MQKELMNHLQFFYSVERTIGDAHWKGIDVFNKNVVDVNFIGNDSMHIRPTQITKETSTTTPKCYMTVPYTGDGSPRGAWQNACRGAHEARRLKETLKKIMGAVDHLASQANGGGALDRICLPVKP